MSKEAFIKNYSLFSNDGQVPAQNTRYSMSRSTYTWKTAIVCHPCLSSDMFDVFDQNHDGVVDFVEFLFMLACDSKSDLAKKYGDIFQM